MLTKNGIYEALIEDYTEAGQGVARIEGCVVFVPGAIRGERCLIAIEKAQKTWAAGKIHRILELSPHRADRACPVGKKCGGCDFWHIDYEEECDLKARRVTNCLNRLAGETLSTVPLLAAPGCTAYRNKVIYPVTQKKGRVCAGFYRAGSHEIVDNPGCLIVFPEADRVKDILLAHCNRFGITAYNETTGKGLLRYIFLRRGWVSGELLVCLVINGKSFPQWEALAEALKAVPGFTTLVLSENTKPGNTVLGPAVKALYGPGYIEDILCGLTFRLSPHSFYQINHPQAQRLYETAISLAGIGKSDLVLDLYCGVGTITLTVAKHAGKVIGVEVVEQAIRDAEYNARKNGIENAEFFCADAGKAALSLEEQGIRPDVITVDPPRKGLSQDAVEAICKMAPQRLVYISCDPATCARDVAKLKEQGGYRLEKALAADLFPRCAHVETVCLLCR